MLAHHHFNLNVSKRLIFSSARINIIIFINLIFFVLGNNPDLLEKIEGLVGVWTKQIEQVLAESEQV